jgi:exodeoxyribonuclease V protein, alpha subunit
MLRNGYTPKIGDYGDVLVIYRSDLVNEMIMASDSIICGTNRTREYFNEMIRRDLLGFKSKLPQYGEKVVCRKNNWHIEVDGINLANGLSGRVSSTTSISKFDGVKFKINFTPDLFPDIVFEDIECDYQYFIADFKARRQMKNLSAIAYGDTGEKFEFGYSITTHMSQGNQYRNGIYIQEYLNPEIQRNLNYTGLTRFRNKCIYVLPSKKTMIPGFRPRVLKKSVVSLNGEPII